MSPESLKDLKEYNKLPRTAEKKEIDRQFLEDEIGSLEFYSKVREYMQNINEGSA